MPGRKGRRKTDLPPVTHGLPKTEQGVRDALARYGSNNSDLDDRIVRYLGIAAISQYFNRPIVERALDIKVPQAYHRDTSWRWWNVLVYSGLQSYWEKFKEIAQRQGVREAARWLRKRISYKRYMVFLKRAGSNPHNSHRGARYILWTKGGAWDQRMKMARIIVLKQHCEQREMVLRWQKRLGHKGVTLIEKELMTLINPDAILAHEARHLAVDYVCNRIAELIHRRRPLHRAAAAWFFSCNVPYKDGDITWVGAQRRKGYIVRRSFNTSRAWSWM